MRHLIRTVAVAGVVALAGAAAAEELTITSSVTTNGKTSTSTAYYGTDKFRTGDGEHETIVDLGASQLTAIDHKDKKYWQTTMAEMEAAMKQLEEQVKQMGPLMEKMMGGPMPEVQVAKGSQPKTIAGYPTEHWVVSAGDWKHEVWAAPTLQPPTGYWNAMKGRYAAMGPMARRFGRLYDEMSKIKGFPLGTSFTFKMMGKGVTTSSEATSVAKGPIPASAFAVPAGYKKQDTPFKNMGR